MTAINSTGSGKIKALRKYSTKVLSPESQHGGNRVQHSTNSDNYITKSGTQTSPNREHRPWCHNLRMTSALIAQTVTLNLASPAEGRRVWTPESMTYRQHLQPVTTRVVSPRYMLLGDPVHTRIRLTIFATVGSYPRHISADRGNICSGDHFVLFPNEKENTKKTARIPRFLLKAMSMRSSSLSSSFHSNSSWCVSSAAKYSLASLAVEVPRPYASTTHARHSSGG